MVYVGCCGGLRCTSIEMDGEQTAWSDMIKYAYAGSGGGNDGLQLVAVACGGLYVGSKVRMVASGSVLTKDV